MAVGRTYILGMDGATWNVINRLLAAGDLPNFRRAIAAGASGPLESVHNLRSASAWTSMFTGCNPGKHGIYEFYEFLPQTYSLKYIHGGFKKVPGYWSILDAANQSVAVVNVPMTYPAEPVARGYIIAGLDGPGKQSPGFTWPRDFMATLERAMGCEYVIEPGLTGAIARGRPDEAVALLKGELDSKTAALRVMLDRMPVDCLAFVYRSLDAAQHGFWKWMDPTHPKHAACPPEEIAKYGRVIDDVYRHLDAALGEIMSRMKSDDHLLVMSDHGFGQKCPVSSGLNRWLEAHGYLVYEKHAARGKPNLVSRLLRFIAARTGRSTKERLVRLFPRLRNWAQSRALFAGVDWSRTRVYSDSQFPRLRLNIKGREGQGIVDPAAAPALTTDLIAKIRAMRDSVTNEPIVRDILLRDEIYSGDHVGPAEDILVRWREDIIISGVKMPPGFDQPVEEFSVMPGEDPRVISGDHQIHGIFIGLGPAFRAAAAINTGLRLLDMTPTILHLRGLPIPSYMDGRVMTPAMNPHWLAQHPVNLGSGKFVAPPSQTDGDQKPADYSDEDEKILEDRLRSLGYIE